MNWTRDHLILALDLYCRLPFGKLDSRTPAIIELARDMGRTPGSLSMKLNNFASFDPALKARGVKGLGNTSRGDRAIWEEFESNWETLALSAAEIKPVPLPVRETEEDPELPSGETESIRMVKIRLVQRFFRDAVLSSYDFTCAFCGIAVPELLIASHIIPWRKDKARRADPRNGLALCGLHDRAFDRGLMSVDVGHRILVSRRLKTSSPPEFHQAGLIGLEGREMRLPDRFLPLKEALDYHRDVFEKGEMRTALCAV
jgi:putative restriction endonuclease